MIECKGYKEWTDCGWEYDCEYDPDESCDDCICNGGKYDPRTGKKYTLWTRFKDWLTLGKLEKQLQLKLRQNNYLLDAIGIKYEGV